MEYSGDTSMMSSQYPDQLSVTSRELNDAVSVNGVDARSVTGMQPIGDDLPIMNGHTASDTIGDTYPTGTDLSWQDGGRPSLSVTNVTTAGASYTAATRKEPDIASIHSSNVANNGSNADSRSIASTAANASVRSGKATLLAHLTSYAEEHTGDCGRGYCAVHEDGRPLTEADLNVNHHHVSTNPPTRPQLEPKSSTLLSQAHKLQQHTADSITDTPTIDVEPALGQTTFPIQNTSAIRSSPHAMPTSAGSRFRLTVPRVALLIVFSLLDLLAIALIIWQITLYGAHELKLAKRCILGGALAVAIITTCIMLTLGRNLQEVLLMALVVIAIGMMLPWELDGLM